MIVDLYDAIDAMVTALAVWFVIGAAIATPVLLVAAWAVTRAVKRACRALSGPCGASDAPDGTPDPQDAHEALSARTEPRTPSRPSWAHDEQEAA